MHIRGNFGSIAFPKALELVPTTSFTVSRAPPRRNRNDPSQTPPLAIAFRNCRRRDYPSGGSLAQAVHRQIWAKGPPTKAALLHSIRRGLNVRRLRTSIR